MKNQIKNKKDQVPVNTESNSMIFNENRLLNSNSNEFTLNNEEEKNKIVNIYLNMIEHIRIDKENKCLYIDDVNITENELKELVISKKKINEKKKEKELKSKRTFNDISTYTNENHIKDKTSKKNVIYSSKQFSENNNYNYMNSECEVNKKRNIIDNKKQGNNEECKDMQMGNEYKEDNFSNIENPQGDVTNNHCSNLKEGLECDNDVKNEVKTNDDYNINDKIQNSNNLSFNKGVHSSVENNKMISSVACLNYLIEHRINKEIDIPQSNTINALFMDFYHLIMAYTYFRQKKHKVKATFEIYFRKCPFEGKFAILAGIYEVIKYINFFRFTKAHLEFIKKKMHNYKDVDLFIEYLSGVSGRDVSIYCMEEGSIVFANEPIMIVEGHLLTCQLLESAIINLLNYPILIATNSLKHKISINYKTLAEFGCRRAQGPDGALSGSKYSAFGCDFTSNVYASYLYDIPLLGTMSHSFILAFQNDEVLNSKYLGNHDFLTIVNKNKDIVHKLYNCEYTKENELTAFVAFAQVNPNNFICLIDTYDSLRSGIFNFLIVALSLHEIKYKPIGIRIDSGDLRYISNECKKIFNDISKKLNVPFYDLKICVSNDINEKFIKFLNEQEHHIDIFAIGTNLITCQSQPSLGLIYKLVEINNEPCFKMTNENKKSNLPYKKNVYRLYTKDKFASVDYVQLFDEEPPLKNEKLFCINVLDESKQCFIIPTKVEKKLLLCWDYGKLLIKFKTLQELKKYTLNELTKFRSEHFCSTLPVPYKVSFSHNYHKLYKNLLIKNSFITTIT
ncbi:nicotinate phosphoribosyltransferase, putative [Plasmodium gallinaceum]|uniref:nicotinate phosphoribosyltransferase n=1 Tax=Plasmodium gallinaceum TaxID=5849 RepID=A0A1J1GNE2_PLAGA|nr:nicotinate phosphoribosyltransferase, putative [Plasmodium gallinaceum]CRG93868.1 nicotinate phosphoribosyltransferase, putative [Plasmodium gallinaceum]